MLLKETVKNTEFTHITFRLHQVGKNERKLHPKVTQTFFLLFGKEQDNRHDIIAEQLSDLLYQIEKEGKR
jgi:hypothetical protein